jgi:16S rRNA processing protein RimM
VAVGGRADGEDKLLEIGHVVKPHGLAGETVVALVSNVPDRLRAGARLTAGTGSAERELVVTASRPFQHRYLVRFQGVGSREAAEALRGVALLAEPLDDPSSLFVHELIGAEVFDLAGDSHGRVAAVQANPASDLLVGEEGWLVPLRFVVESAAGRIVVDGPAGIFDG